ncbi:hypothetical protein GYMLUDRAFT_56948 [Collybiopsis luxurians FD-317 M1]|nr:hypothetical protein GYMLUDRAFT_56948 [Collybiopsis luxurians FD-317 M1]
MSVLVPRDTILRTGSRRKTSRKTESRSTKEGRLPRLKHIIRIPKPKLKSNPTTLAEASSSSSSFTPLPTQTGLFIIIPPASKRTPSYDHDRAGVKRVRVVATEGAEEEQDSERGEDDTLILRNSQRPSKRRRLSPQQSPNTSNQSDDDSGTLIRASSLSGSTPKPKISSHKLRNPVSTTPPTQPSSYTGSFELYAMDHQDLCEIYRPQGSLEPQYKDLYHTLQCSHYVSPINSDSDSDADILDVSEKLTALVTIPPYPYGRKFGSIYAKAFSDPVSNRPYDIQLTRISHVSRVFYKDHEKESFATRYNTDVSHAGKLPGVHGKTGVSAQDSSVIESSGDLNMSRVWEKVDSDGKLMEIFEGYLSLRVRYCKAYGEMGYRDGLDVGFAFWAVRR